MVQSPHMKNIQKYVAAGILLAVAIAAFVFISKYDTNGGAAWNGTSGEPADIVTDFYQKWMDRRTAGDAAVPMRDFLAAEPLAEGVRDTIINAESSTVDPVICRQSEIEGMRVQIGFITDTASQILVLAPSADFGDGYAIVDLAGKEGTWQIEKITCAAGEIVPEEKEFTFDAEGTLVKQVPPPFAAGKWHVIYKDAAQQVGLVPLQIGAKSVCSLADGTATACDDSFLVEAVDVHVYGSMTETGVDVARIERK